MKAILAISFLSIFISNGLVQAQTPVTIGIAGLSHAHVHWLLGQSDRQDIKLVGIAEPDRELAKRYAKQYGYSMDLVFDTIEDMIQKTQPVAVTAFGSIFQHLEVVEKCAPLGIHVMVEKPLAVNLAHATKMKQLAEKHNILLITNYETTWYATNHLAYKMVKDNRLGQLTKIVVHDGHEGPKEIGVNKEFLAWLTDPKLNGGGAVIDFGCYGANLITWLTNGERPISVTAITQTFKPDVYPNVDDEATILIKYKNKQGIIQASWNWPFSRKDMELYGKTGYIISDNKSEIRYRLKGDPSEKKEKLEDRPPPYDDPFGFFASLINQQTTMANYDLSSLENNMMVVEILEAAIKSAATGKTVLLSQE